MKKPQLQLLLPGILAVFALALTVSAGAQAPAATTSPQAAPTPDHEAHAAVAAESAAEMKAECEAMMAKKREMQDKVRADDARLDELVAKMNAAKGSKERDALEKPMAAVLDELVAQRKSSHSMMMEMQPEMMAHMMRHMRMHGKMGEMECPMMMGGMTH
jgi:hypothetical protein